MKTSLIQKAENAAYLLHDGQIRKDGVTPYINHPEAVYGLLSFVGIKDEDTLCSAWLHDTMEDCGVIRRYLEREFNSNIARIVSALTRDVSREEYNNRIRNSDFSVKVVKLADTIHNCYDMYCSHVSEGARKRKVDDCNNFYFNLAKETYKPFEFLLKNVVNQNICLERRCG